MFDNPRKKTLGKGSGAVFLPASCNPELYDINIDLLRFENR